MKCENIYLLLSQYWLIASVSILIFIGIIFMVPFFIIHLPTNYFAQKKVQGILRKLPFPLNTIVLIIKNIAGFLLLLLGVLFLFTPGQGLLTIFTGLILMNFPGKRRLELFLVRKKSILNAMNWIRFQAGKEALNDVYSV